MYETLIIRSSSLFFLDISSCFCYGCLFIVDLCILIANCVSSVSFLMLFVCIRSLLGSASFEYFRKLFHILLKIKPYTLTDIAAFA
jgi:hypothetical protein